jgi:hypothetical protein
MNPLEWHIVSRSDSTAVGREHVYRICAPATQPVRLARVLRSTLEREDAGAATMAETLRTATAVAGHGAEAIFYATALAQQFEDGRPLGGRDEWQDPPGAPEPRAYPAPAPPPHPELGPDSGHQADGPANCVRCQMIRDNAHWMATGEVDGGELRTLGTTGGRPGPMGGAPGSRFLAEDAATVAGQVMREFPADRETPGRILDMAEHEAEHLKLTGPLLVEHLKASPAAQPVRGHGVPRLARQAGAANGYDGLQALHRRRHELSEGHHD